MQVSIHVSHPHWPGPDAQVARVAAAYVAPSGLLVHVLAAPYLYTVRPACPYTLYPLPYTLYPIAYTQR